MSLNIKQVHDRMNFLIRKNKWGYVKPEDIDIALDMAQMELFDEYYGDPKKYRYGRPIPPEAYGQTQRLKDPIMKFMKRFHLNGTNGFTEFPADYIHLDSAFLSYTDEGGDRVIPLPQIKSDRQAFRRNSQLLPVTNVTDPAHAFIVIDVNDAGKKGVQIYPKANYITAEAYYVSSPPTPVYGYTQTGRVITYDANLSTDLMWNNDDIKKIIAKAIQYVGINLNDSTLIQGGQIKDN